jgi:hypothetical protein
MNATNSNRPARTIRARRPRWDVVVYHHIGLAGQRGPGYSTRADAMAAAQAYADQHGRIGQLVGIMANVEVEIASWALIGGRWVPDPSPVDIIAATREIDPAYARQLWSTLATAATAAGRAWTCAYVNTADQAVAWAWSERVNVDTIATARLAA